MPPSRIVLAAVVLLGAASLSAHGARAADGRQLISLDRGWKFLASDNPAAPGIGLDDHAWQLVDLPHTWNALDGQDGGDDYRRGAGWYRRHLSLEPSLAGKRLYLQFDGASLKADVFVNGVQLGSHLGGFARFRIDATGALRAGADNLIAVRVDNGNLGIPPTASDFTIFGGLYRGVSLLVTDPVQISAMDMGSPGVFVEQGEVSERSASVMVRAEIENHAPLPREVDVQVTILDASGACVAGADSSFRVHLEQHGANEVAKRLVIPKPRFWNARADPYLYTVRVELMPVAENGAKGPLSDAVEQPLGVRTFAVDPDRGFILNGKYLDLYGFNRHQDWPDKGWAISDADEAADFALMMDSGATAVRVSHYQQSESWYSRCDSAGLVAWAEIPFWGRGLSTQEFLENAKQQMRELIRQNFNHPSVCFWGVGNETAGPASESVIEALTEVVREEDPSRLSTYASNHDDADPKNWHTDVVAFNRYFGWYRGQLSDFAAWLDKTRADFPRARFAMSEFGAGGSIFQHQENPGMPVAGGPFHPEEYQSLFHEAYWAALRDRPYVWAKFIWCLHDFASDGRNEGDHPGRNDKGLVTYDRRVLKDAFYFYKANWSAEPVLHITSRRFTERTEAVTEVKVYSNAPEVTLVVNGISLGARRDPENGRIFRWPGVRLSPGQNRVEARAGFGAESMADACSWTLAKR